MIRNNIRAEGRVIVKTWISLSIMLAVSCACAILLSGRLGVMVEKLSQSPVEVLALLGIYNIEQKHISLMIFYMVAILLNIVAISKAAGAAVEAVKEDEENGSIRFFMHQTYSCDQIWIGKMGVAIGSALMQWVLYVISMILMVGLICYRYDLLFAVEVQNVVMIGIRGGLFVVLAVGICLLYSLKEDLEMTYEYFVSSVFWGCFLVGNLYKVFAMLSCYTASARMEMQLRKLEGIFENLRILFPFTVLNVFHEGKMPLPNFTYIIYALITVVILLVYGYAYRRDRK
ncbi:MAG: hypothetical protein IJE49_01745 [Agathobacter sp.]|nr:hypothetical protein [Agathobacter sp.]